MFCIIVLNFVEIGRNVAEISQYNFRILLVTILFKKSLDNRA